MKKLFLFLIVFLFPLLTYPATTVYENGTLKGYVNALNFKNATVTKSGIIAIVDASGGTGPAGTNGTNGSNATVAVANISVNYTQPMFKFIAGQNVTSITLVNDTVGGAVNITINTIDTTGAAGNPFDQVLNTTSSVNFTAINTTGNATSSFFIGNGSFLMGIPTNATVDAKGTSNLTVGDIDTNANVTKGVNANATITTHVANTTIHVTAANKSTWDANTNETTSVTDTPSLDLTLTGVAISGVVQGANLTSLNASNLSVGTVAVARGGTGAANLDNLIALTQNTTGNYVASVATTAPLSGGAAGSEGGALTIVIPKANSMVDGYLNMTDWSTFNAKGTSNLTANDTVYGAGWDGKTAEVPSQNAVYDKIELVADSNSYALKNQTKSLSIYNITTAHDILLWKTPKAITITNITAVCTGGTSVTGMIAECNATGQTCVDANSTIVVAAGTQVDTGAPTDASIDALDWLFWNTSAVSGTPTNFAVTIKYNE